MLMQWNTTRVTPIVPDQCVTVAVVTIFAKTMATVNATETVVVEGNVRRGGNNPMVIWMSPLEALQMTLRLPVAVMAVVAHPMMMVHTVAISPRKVDQVEDLDLEEDGDQVVVVVTVAPRAASPLKSVLVHMDQTWTVMVVPRQSACLVLRAMLMQYFVAAPAPRLRPLSSH